MLDKKLQLRDGQTIYVTGDAPHLDLRAAHAQSDSADAILAFTLSQQELSAAIPSLQAAAARGALVWVAYPKAKQLNTDLNRDIVRELANQNRLDTIRQIAIDDTWSALRLKTLAA